MGIYSKIGAYESFIRRSTLNHNNKYDYSSVKYINAHTKVQIICPIHGEFLQTPDSHLSCGCPKCKGDEASLRCRLSQEEVMSRIIATHGDKYDYSLVEYVNQSTKIKIICSDHGIFEQSPQKHWNGQSCPTCVRRDSSIRLRGINKGPSKKRITLETFIKRATELFGDTYDYSKTKLYSIKSEVEIICRNHGSFMKKADKHLLGRGCPRCSNGKQYSKESEDWLNSLDVSVLREYRLPERKVRVVDGYDPITNTVYQFHGDYWHGNPKRFDPQDMNITRGIKFGDLYDITCRADKEIKDFGYNLIVMWESDWRQSG